MLEAVMEFDAAAVFFFEERIRFAALDAAMVCITTLGNSGGIWVLAGAAMLCSKKHRRRGLYLLACLALSAVIGTLILKNLISRPRPFVELAELTLLVRTPGGFSFPSGHAGSGFAAAYALTRMFGRRWALTYILAALIAVSRVYVGVHYPSDIIAGAIVGTACAAVFLRCVKIPAPK